MSKYSVKCTLNFKRNNAAEAMKLNYLKKELLLSGRHSSKVFVRREGVGQDNVLALAEVEETIGEG